MEKVVPYELIKNKDPKIKQVEETFKHVFGDSVAILTKSISRGGTSNLIFLPKKFGVGKLVTIIIWDKKYVYKDGRIIECNGTHRK